MVLAEANLKTRPKDQFGLFECTDASQETMATELSELSEASEEDSIQASMTDEPPARALTELCIDEYLTGQVFGPRPDSQAVGSGGRFQLSQPHDFAVGGRHL